ncbi:hypothetical protein LINGRAHAP2_LOCUS10563, partial [Linum grandiflorum]
MGFGQRMLSSHDRKLGHVGTSTLARLSNLGIVRGLPKLGFTKNFFYDACAKGKHSRTSFKSKTDMPSSRCLELIHMDLFGPLNVVSI